MILMMGIAGLSGVLGVWVLLLTASGQSEHSVAHLAAMGWPPNRIYTTVGALVIMAVVAANIVGTIWQDTATGIFAGVIVGTWLPWLASITVRAMARASYLSERDKAILEWMRKLRLLTAAGQPINAAAVNAAMTVAGRAFTPVRGSIGAALDAGRDPLPAVLSAITGSSVEPLLASVVAAERAGAASSNLLDHSLARSVRTLESARRLAVDQLSRAIGTTVTLVSAIAGLTVMAAVIFVL